MTRQRLQTFTAGSVLLAVATLLGGWAAGGAAQTTDLRAATLTMPDFRLVPTTVESDPAATLARALFNPSRRPLPAPDAPEASLEPAPATRLIAVAIGPDRSAAVLQLTSGKTSVLLQGERIDGWVLSLVAPDHVLLRSNERQVALALSAHPSAARNAGQTSGQ